ncbi:MAG: ABC transporter permease [Cytophagaceae bacterium]|nr:ABC transporter permease [Cytophagaceae bacterium]
MNFPRFVSRRLRHNKTHSFSTTVARIGVVSIAVGLGVMLVAFAVLFGFKQAVQQKVFSLAAHLRVTKFTINRSFEETPLPLKSPLYANYKRLPAVQHLQAVAHKGGILKTKEDLLGALLKGVGPDYDWPGFRANLIAGRIPNFPDSTDSKEILISQRIADKLRLGPGDAVTMYFLQQPPRARRLNVVGIYETGLEEFDNQLIIGDLRLVQKLNGWGSDTVGTYEIFVRDVAQLDDATNDVARLLTLDQDVEKVTDRYQPLFDWLTLLDRNIVIFLTLILAVCSFNMASILLVMMMERTPMIGLMKALGSTDWQIRQIFLYQGLALISRGMLWGNLLGLGFCWLQARFHLIPLNAQSYYMDTVPIAWNWPAIALLNAATLVLVSAVLLIPTLVITRIQPVKAIVFNK